MTEKEGAAMKETWHRFCVAMCGVATGPIAPVAGSVYSKFLSTETGLPSTLTPSERTSIVIMTKWLA